MMNPLTQPSIRDEQLDSGAGTTASRLPGAAFGARAAVLAGVVATACATAAPAALAAGSPAAPAMHVQVTVALNGPAGALITPLDSTCCI